MRSRAVLTSVLFSAAVILCSAGPAQAAEYVSQWTAAPVAIDGNMLEWQGDPLAEEGKVDVNYGFRNDGNYLYILFQFTDMRYLSTLKWTGMNVYIDTQGKKSKDYALNFQKKQVTAEEFLEIMRRQRGELSEADINQIRSNPSYVSHMIELVDKNSGDDEPVDIHGPNQATFRSMGNPQQQIYTFEFAIPLERDADKAGVGAQPGSTVKVGFEWGGSTREYREAMQSGGLVARTAAAGDALNDANGLPFQPPSGGDLTRMRAPKYSFWVDVKLADRQ
jgi:hypothetical protein